MWSLLRTLLNRLTPSRADDQPHPPPAATTDGLVASPIAEPADRAPVSLARKKQRHRFKKRPADAIDRHGFPRLTGKEDLHSLFTGSTPHRQKTFSELMDRTGKAEYADAAGSISKCGNGDIAVQPPHRNRPYPLPETELDLHGLTATQATMKSDAFIRNARSSGCKAIRIITGKGLHSEGDAVLRDVIEAQLVALKATDIIRTFQWEQRIKRKSGAVLVFFP